MTDLLISASRPDRGRSLPSREARVELVLALAVVSACVLLAVFGTRVRAFELFEVGACVLAYVVAARITLYMGGGSALPTQLALVPMLFLLPLALVPLAVLCACALASLARRGSPVGVRLLTGAGDAGYVFAPVAVLIAAGRPSLDEVTPLVLALAMLAQWGLDAILSVGREWLGRGIRPAAQLRVMALVWAVDLLLLPVGLLVVAVASNVVAAVLALIPMLVLLGAITHDRNERLVEALERLEELERNRARVRTAVQRLGRSIGASLDRATTLEVILDAAMDVVAVPVGRIEAGDHVHDVGWPSIGVRTLVAQAEKAALALDGPARAEADGWVALAEPLRVPAGGTLAVAGPRTTIAAEDERLLAYLSGQAASALRVIDLHELLERQATVDEMTGLANHRRFQETLGKAVAHAGRADEPVSLILVDVDNFKRVNDTFGHQCGDEVLKAIGAILRERTRAADTPARYGGEELAVIMPGADAAGACALAEELRAAVAAAVVDGPEGPVSVTASFGVAQLGPSAPDGEGLVAAADAALYVAKRTGKDRVIFDRAATTFR
ncbi:GGDEF domain-containing protein [Solirubrobacter phytolaccae]|uniref:GGDEF domain-containing protein n=1 Tax=Solirubrobacter phytolaccae TaxID=1404360 RepID=A0A9X3S935_9ACTN|nr:GGDEF domain-containing protein [Solirubrobacter phytolaccae]MDA0181086.1 GGDEF domain-containing protein [Solirubrobacter phytolaccae]